MPDFAAICMVAGVLLVIVLLFVHFILWLRVRYDVKGSLQLWEQRLAAVESSVPKDKSPQLAADIQGLGLKLANVEESLHNFMKKDAAREREKEKRAAKAEKDDQADDQAEGGDPLAAALVEQQAMFAQGARPTAAPGARKPRLVPIRKVV